MPKEQGVQIHLEALHQLRQMSLRTLTHCGFSYHTSQFINYLRPKGLYAKNASEYRWRFGLLSDLAVAVDYEFGAGQFS